MNGDVLIQNLINIFIIAVILEAAIMAIFSMSALKDLSDTRPVEASRDLIIIVLAAFLTIKVSALRIFPRTGLGIPKMLDIIISALVLARMANFVRQLMSRLRKE